MNLIITGQTTKFMDVELTKEDNYVKWLKLVAHEEKIYMQHFENGQATKLPIMFQLELTMDGQQQNNDAFE